MLMRPPELYTPYNAYNEWIYLSIVFYTIQKCIFS